MALGRPGRGLGGHRLPQLQEAGTELLEDPGGDAFALAGQAQQQVLGAEPVAFQAHRLTAGQAQHEGEGLSGGEAEAHARLAGTLANGCFDPAANRLGRDPQSAKGGHGQAFLVIEQAEQQVLGADAVMPEPASLPFGLGDGVLSGLGHTHRPTSFQGARGRG